jgi:cobalt/nickel transport system permease protein
MESINLLVYFKCLLIYIHLMHIPDGFLDTKTIVATTAFSVVGFGTAMHKLKNTILPQQIPMIGLTAAFVFVAQMLNFPVVAGTSGHLLGSVLTSVLLGPSAAVVVITSVLIVQCFLFADGGVLALGANIFNMALIGSFFGYLIYRIVNKMIPGRRGWFAGILFASWCSTVIASVFCAGELAWSGTVRWSAAFPVMANVHMLIGIGEGLLSVLIIAAIWKSRPDLLEENLQRLSPTRYKEFIIYGIITIMGLLIFVTPFISRLPDGLEKAAALLGFETKALEVSVIASPMNGYKYPDIGSSSLATTLAGLVGAVVVFILSLVISSMLVKKSDKQRANKIYNT